MTDNGDEAANYIISVFDLDHAMQEAADGIEVAATMKSLEISLHQIVLGNRDATPDTLSYLFIRHVSDLLQFAKREATISKLQRLLETLDNAKNALEQDEDAESLLRDAWQLMRRVLSQEEVEKVPASQIELRRSEMDAIVLSGTDAWEQANQLSRSWSILEHEGQRVEYMVRYNDGQKDGRWFTLPLFYRGYGEPFLVGPVLSLEEQVIAILQKGIDQASEQQASFDEARSTALAYLRQYAVGGAHNEAVTTAILRIQEDHWSPDKRYRRSLHREGSF